MKHIVFLILLLVVLLFTFTNKSIQQGQTLGAKNNQTFWKVQSIDTMKYSRDLAREKASDPKFDETIEQQVSAISEIGATHIAIGTPYDEEFVPYIKRWISLARKYHLNVWFRGNLAGWEGWFGYQKISRQTHTQKIILFIESHHELFENGDIFTSCPECENGGPGDPRNTGDSSAYRQFLINEYNAVNTSFEKIGKKIDTNYYSMNGDVANLIMNPETTSRFNGVISIDHYVKSSEKLISDIKNFSLKSEGKVLLGEFGVPIPDLQGKMTEKQQADFMNKVMEGLYQNKDRMEGINYWVSHGGTTALYDENNKPKEVVNVLKKYYRPSLIEGTVMDTLSRKLSNITVRTINGNVTTQTDKNGYYQLLLPAESIDLVFENPEYLQIQKTIHPRYSESIQENIYLTPKEKTFIYNFRESLKDKISDILNIFN